METFKESESLELQPTSYVVLHAEFETVIEIDGIRQVLFSRVRDEHERQIPHWKIIQTRKGCIQGTDNPEKWTFFLP